MSLDIQIPKLSVNLNRNQSTHHNLSIPISSCISQKHRRDRDSITSLQDSIPHNSSSPSNKSDCPKRESRSRRIGRNLRLSLPNVHDPNPGKMGYIPRPSEMRERFQPEGTSGMLLLGWALSSLLVVIIPLSKWATERGRYYNYYGQYNAYEQQQQQYEQGNNGNYNGNWNGGYNICSWWNFSCRYKMRRYSQMYGNNGDGGDQEQAQMRAMLPGWYFFFGGSVEEDERQREEMGMNSNEGSMKFVYTCTIIMFIGLSIFGFRAMYAGKDRMGVIAALLIFGMFTLMNLLTTVQGTVETDGRFFENSVYGWFGQWSVLLAYTDFWIMLHCFIFAGFIGLLRCLDRKAHQDATLDQSQRDNMEMGYVQEDSVLSERQRYS